MCRVISYVVGRGCLLWLVHSFGKTLSTLPCFVLYSRAKLACYSRKLLTSYFSFQSPMMKRTSFFFFGTHTHTFKACIKGKTKATQVRSMSRRQRRCDAAELRVCQAAPLGSDRHRLVLPLLRHASIPWGRVFDSPSIGFHPIAVAQSLSHVWLCKCPLDGVFSKVTSSLDGNPQEELVTS